MVKMSVNVKPRKVDFSNENFPLRTTSTPIISLIIRRKYEHSCVQLKFSIFYRLDTTKAALVASVIRLGEISKALKKDFEHFIRTYLA